MIPPAFVADFLRQCEVRDTGLRFLSPRFPPAEVAMSRHSKSDISRAMAQMPGGLFVMTSAWEGHAGAVLAKWVQSCSDSPAMVMVAINRGQHIEPLLRNSRSFVLCQISESDRFLLRKFNGNGNGNGHAHGHAGAAGNGEAHRDHDDDP